MENYERYWPEARITGLNEGRASNLGKGFCTLQDAVLYLYKFLMVWETWAIQEAYVFDCDTGDHLYKIDGKHMEEFRENFNLRPLPVTVTQQPFSLEIVRRGHGT